MSKYKFKDLKRRPESQQLPDDVNEEVEVIADRAKDVQLKEALVLARKKRYYGTLYHTNKDGEVDSYFEFCSGICIRSRLVKFIDKNNSFHMSVINRKVTFKKDEIEDVQEE